jgi:hypothetical protein
MVEAMHYTQRERVRQKKTERGVERDLFSRMVKLFRLTPARQTVRLYRSFPAKALPLTSL